MKDSPKDAPAAWMRSLEGEFQKLAAAPPHSAMHSILRSIGLPTAWRTLAMTRGAARLERGMGGASAIPRVTGAMLGRIYERVYLRHGARPLVLPAGMRAVAIGGATLGGSYKTPLAIASAIELAKAGARVVFVGHAYGVELGASRPVDATDHAGTVGDEAMLAWNALSSLGVPVVVGPDRESALALAATHGKVAVVDGTTSITGREEGAVVRVLAAASIAPWGSGLVFPLGDLRASPRAFLARGDVLAKVAFERDIEHGCAPDASASRAQDPLAGLSGFSDLAGHAKLELPAFLEPEAGILPRVGVFTALARPERFLRALRARGIEPVAVVRAPDHHGRASREEARREASNQRLDFWLTTAKCALSLGETWLGAPRHVVPMQLALTPTFCERLRRLIDGP